jgi:hypothetical protein
VAQIGPDRRPVSGTEKYVECDTLLLSVGLIPENELTRGAEIIMETGTNGAAVDDTFMTSVPGIFSCGNVLHVHDLVDYVSEEATMVGRNAVAFLKGDIKSHESYIDIRPGEGVGYVLPQKVNGERDFVLSLRVKEPYRDRAIMVRDGKIKVKRKKMVRLHPAEMIRIPVRAGKMGEVRSLEVCVE